MIEAINMSKLNVMTDWLEMSCLFDKDDSISRSELFNFFDEKDVVDQDDIDSMIDTVFTQIKSRHYLAKNTYPLKIENNCIVRSNTWMDSLIYTFMLLISNHSLYDGTEIQRGRWNKPSKIFEKIVTSSLRADFGRAIGIGSPRPRGHIYDFSECIKFICKVIYEPLGPWLGVTGDEQDEGADVIAWKPYDNRNGQVIILVQCASGEEKPQKRKELRIRAWKDIINFTEGPLLGYAIPHVIIDQREWRNVAYDGGIIYDRLRIISLAPKQIQNTRFKSEIIDWIKEQIVKLPILY